MLDYNSDEVSAWKIVSLGKGTGVMVSSLE